MASPNRSSTPKRGSSFRAKSRRGPSQATLQRAVRFRAGRSRRRAEAATHEKDAPRPTPRRQATAPQAPPAKPVIPPLQVTESSPVKDTLSAQVRELNRVLTTAAGISPLAVELARVYSRVLARHPDLKSGRLRFPFLITAVDPSSSDPPPPGRWVSGRTIAAEFPLTDQELVDYVSASLQAGWNARLDARNYANQHLLVEQSQMSIGFIKKVEGRCTQKGSSYFFDLEGHRCHSTNFPNSFPRSREGDGLCGIWAVYYGLVKQNPSWTARHFPELLSTTNPKTGKEACGVTKYRMLRPHVFTCLEEALSRKDYSQGLTAEDMISVAERLDIQLVLWYEKAPGSPLEWLDHCGNLDSPLTLHLLLQGERGHWSLIRDCPFDPPKGIHSDRVYLLLLRRMRKQILADRRTLLPWRVPKEQRPGMTPEEREVWRLAGWTQGLRLDFCPSSPAACFTGWCQRIRGKHYIQLPDEEIYRFISSARQPSITMGFTQRPPLEGANLGTVDINSFFPSIMADTAFPCGTPMWASTEYRQGDKGYWECRAYPPRDTGGLSLVTRPLRLGSDRERVPLHDDGSWTCVLPSNLIEEALKWGWRLDIGRGVRFSARSNLELGRHIRPLFALKQAASAAGAKALKKGVNNLYGYLGKNPVTECVVSREKADELLAARPPIWDLNVEEEDGTVRLEKFPGMPSEAKYPKAISLWVAAEARIRLYRVFRKCPGLSVVRLRSDSLTGDLDQILPVLRDNDLLHPSEPGKFKVETQGWHKAVIHNRTAYTLSRTLPDGSVETKSVGTIPKQ